MASCQALQHKNESTDKVETGKPVLLADIEPRLATFDSAAILVYDDPFGGDPKRYTRYYKLKEAKDSINISLLHQQLEAGFTKSDTLRNCRSEGKIHLFDHGQVKQTLYFATRPQECHHVYIIHNGAYYYMPMLPVLDSAFVQWKKEAVVVPNEGLEQ